MTTKSGKALIVAVCSAALLYCTIGSAQLFDLGDGNAVSGLSFDGSVATGTNFSEYFIWTAGGGIQGIGGQAPGNGIGGQAKISNDGTRISGTEFNAASDMFEMSYYDTTTGNWNNLGGIGSFCTGGPGNETSSGWSISSDGMSVVGLGWAEFCGPAHAIQWNQSTGMTMDLGSTVKDRSSRANGTNHDGMVVVGWQDRMDGFRQGAVWNNGVQTVIMTDSLEPVSEANDVSASGEWVVGNGSFSTNDEAWRWSESTGVESLGSLIQGGFFPRGFATGISDDGSVIVGFERELGSPPTGGVGFIWTEQTGIMSLNDFADSLGIDRQGFNMSLPLSISGDGRTIGGAGVPGGQPFGNAGFVLTIPIPEPASASLLLALSVGIAIRRKRG